ncbi:MAG: XdhC family protein [Phycisphaerales bacterium]|nr:MAG: XdhC family protein [Phycisphaerales bacterium]
MDRDHGSAEIHRRVLEFIDHGRLFTLALVLSAEGSTPRKAAVRAVIDETGKIYGTLGGGLVEAEAQHRAVEVCQTGRPAVFEMRFQGGGRADDEPICGGSMRILLDPKAAKDRECFARVVEAAQQRCRGIILTTVRTAGHTEAGCQWFGAEQIPTDAAFPGAQKIRSCLARETPELFVERSKSPEVATEVLVEPMIPKPLLLIAGGGHVGQAVAAAADLVGFDVNVIDDRPEFTDEAMFRPETTTRCGDIPKQIAALSAPGETYIVIVTRGHKLDAETLEACIHAPVAYIGMIGSKRKVSLIRKNFVESGLATEEQFDRVFTPIGLDIGAVTVPEIAASITAELIAVRRKGIIHKAPDTRTP